MADLEIARYGRKVMNYFFDGIPRNDVCPSATIYCLGQRYNSSPPEVATTTETNLEPVIISHSVHSPSDTTTQNSELELNSEPEEITKSQLTATDSSERLSRATPLQTSAKLYDDEGGWPFEFLDDFESRIWMTYRSNFPPIPKSQETNSTTNMSFAVRLRNLTSNEGFTADTGWGCMIRSGQSLLANALAFTRLGRDWRYANTSSAEASILSLFADDPKAPFSIHKFVGHGAAACGKHPGEWFGPSATARCIKALVDRYAAHDMAAYITSDCSDVYEDLFFKHAKASDEGFKPTIVLVSTRLGLDRVTPVYWEALKAALQMPQSIGIAGGRPSSSHYFVATQGNDFFYLDPHHTRTALPYHSDTILYSEGDIASCHTRRLRRLNISGMDPSMLIGFLIRDEDDWQAWRTAVTQVSGKPIIHVHDRENVHSSVVSERQAAIDEVETFDTEDEI